MLYVATNRLSFVVVGLIAAAIGFLVSGARTYRTSTPGSKPGCIPLNPRLYNAPWQLPRSPTPCSPKQPRAVRTGFGRRFCPCPGPGRHPAPLRADGHDLRGRHR